MDGKIVEVVMRVVAAILESALVKIGKIKIISYKTCQNSNIDRQNSDTKAAVLKVLVASDKENYWQQKYKYWGR